MLAQLGCGREESLVFANASVCVCLCELYCRGAEAHCNAAPERGRERRERRSTHARDAG